MNPSNISSIGSGTSSLFSTLSESSVPKQVSERVLELREKIEKYKEYKSKKTKNAKDALEPLFQEISQILNNPTFDIIAKSKGKSATQEQAQQIINRQKDYENAPIKQQVINYRDKSNISFFEDLCQGAPLEIIKIFTPDKITEEINRASNEGWTPLQRAIANKQPLNVIEYLIDIGANVNQLNTINQFSPLHIALMHTVMPDDKKYGENIVRLLEKKGAHARHRSQELSALEVAYQAFEGGLNNERRLRIEEQNKGQPESFREIFKYHPILNESEKNKFFQVVRETVISEVSKTTARELNAAIEKEGEGKGKSNISKLLLALKNSPDKEEISNLPINGQLPFHKACRLLKEAVIKEADKRIIDRRYSIVQDFIQCGADLILKVQCFSGAEVQIISGLTILSSEKGEEQKLLAVHSKNLETFARKHAAKTNTMVTTSAEIINKVA